MLQVYQIFDVMDEKFFGKELPKRWKNSWLCATTQLGSCLIATFLKNEHCSIFYLYLTNIIQLYIN